MTDATRTVRCGRDSTIEIDGRRIVRDFRGPTTSGDSVGRRIRAALDDPIDLPPFSRGLAPGDRLAIALDNGLPNASEILTPILEALRDAGVPPSHVQTLMGAKTSPAFVDRIVDELPDELADVELALTHPEDHDSFAYLASLAEGRRIYLDRRLVDADAVLVVGRAEFDPIVGFRGAGAGELFPDLSDLDTLRSSRLLALEVRSAADRLRSRQGCDEVAWLLGVLYSVSVGLDRNGEPAQAWFGHYESVRREGKDWLDRHWTVPAVDPEPDWILATVFGQQVADWTSVAAGLETVGEFSRTAPILLLTDLEEPPGPTLRWLTESDNPWNVLHRLRSPEAAEHEDLLATAQIAHALANRTVYLYSRLEPSVVESLGMEPVRSQAELHRLLSGARGIAVVEDADRARVSRNA